ncbi:hypothetical protein AB0J86_31825 [Micromonospora sp. NPDC049559]|uniref:hypothetical protein n=1 Tax=Micromonospora sp. NPDC049559 TaxID=3155923 RepID=UPI00343D904E
MNSEQVLVRVLTALETASARGVPLPRRVPSGPLPRRVPGGYSLPRRSGFEGPPLTPVRNPVAIGENAAGYLRGWRLGRAALRVHGPGRLAAEGVVGTAPPAAPPREIWRRRSAVRIRSAATRLVGLVVRILPEAEQPRYSEEFRAELSGLTGRHQLAYAARLLLSAPALRRSLREELRGDATRTR